MKNLIFLASSFMFLSTFGQEAPAALRTWVGVLASDSLEGREFGTPGGHKAAKYLQSVLKDLSVAPAGTSGYFQEVKAYADPHGGTPKHVQTGQNVIGIIDNPNSEEVIVIGAHFDHLGYGTAFGSLHGGDSAIHYGADDNASGVAICLDLMKKYATAPLQKDLVFIAFTGEEKGLYGSNTFCDTPTIPLDKVVAMINLDMVGRLNSAKELAISGSGTSPYWEERLPLLNSDSLKIVFKPSGVGPSDHTSFYLKNIPVIHLFTGQHADYHRPSDQVHKLNFEGMELISSFLQNILQDLAIQESIAFTKTVDTPQTRISFKVTLGVMPDYLFNGKGMAISSVLDNRPAQQAGIEAGDIVVKMGELTIDSMQDYMQALNKFSPGEQVNVSINRNQQIIVLQVVF